MNKLLNISLALVVTINLSCRKSETAAESSDVRVENGHVLIATGSPPATAIGLVRPVVAGSGTMSFSGRLVWDDNLTTRLFSPFSGRVTAVRVEQGQRVQSGTVLAVIASPDFGQFQADARRAATDLALAERTLARVHELFEHGAAPQKDLQTAETDAEHARLERQRTVERLALYGVSTNGVDQAYLFRSPISGVIVEKNINIGSELRSDLMLANTPQLAAPQFVISEPDRLWVLIDVSERDQGKVHAGQKIIIRSASFPDRIFPGQIDWVGDALDSNTRTVRVRGSLANSERMLKSEMFVKAEVEVVPESGVTVPTKAVFLHGTQHCVIVEDSPGSFSRRQVKLGSSSEEQTLITEGLLKDQNVVLGGNMLLEQLLSSGL